MFSGVSKIPYNSGYVVRGIEKDNFDQIAANNEVYLKQYEIIFRAALCGNFRKVQEVVKRGFWDFNAYSVGCGFDDLTILQIAEQKGHVRITHYLQKFTLPSKESKKSEEAPTSGSEEEEGDLSEEHLDISKLFKSLLSLHVTSETIIQKISSSPNEEELFMLIDAAIFQEGDRNPITYILGEGEQDFLKCYKADFEKVIQKLLQKFPVEERHLSALLKRNFSDELISQVINKMPLTAMSDVKIAIEENWSYKYVEKIFDKVKTYNDAPWDSLFPFKFINLSSRCWNNYATQPKPYLQGDKAIPLSLLKKFLIYFPINSLPTLENLIGRVNEEVLWLFVDRVDVGTHCALKHILLCGYSDKFVLHVFENIEDGALGDDDVVKIAQLRDYPKEVVALLKKKVK